MAEHLSAADFPVPDEQQTRILDGLLTRMDGDVTPSDTPLLAIVTGQPASGKSRTIGRLSRVLDTPAVTLDSDELRLAHPSMDEIIAADPQRMDVLSNGPVGAWMAGSITHARSAGYDVIIENTLTNPGQVAATAGDFRRDGYQVSIVALAVPEEDSRLRIVQRYLAGQDTDPFPRWTTEHSHSSAYTGMDDGLEQMTDVVDSIEVYDRNGGPLYAGPDGRAAATAVTEQRGRPKDVQQTAAWSAEYRRVVDRLLTPGMLTDQTRTVIGNLVADAERIVAAEQLPESHQQLRAQLA